MKRALGLLVIAFALTGCVTVERVSKSDVVAVTTVPPLPEGACVAYMADPSPGQGGSVSIFVYSHFASVPVIAVVHYKSTDTEHVGSINADKQGELEFSIGQPTKGHTVIVDLTVRGATANETCKTAFTPK